MTRWHPKKCRVPGCCAPPEAISARGYCIEHGRQRMNANNVQIALKRGPFFEGWYEAMRQRFEYPRFPEQARSER